VNKNLSSPRNPICTAGLQIRRRTLEEETKRCPSFPAASPRLGIPTAPFSMPRVPPHSSRQGSPTRLQGKARFLHLPCKGSPRREEASSFQGHPIWQACSSRCQEAEICAQSPLSCGGACRPTMWSASCAELILVE